MCWIINAQLLCHAGTILTTISYMSFAAVAKKNYLNLFRAPILYSVEAYIKTRRGRPS